MDFTVHVLAAVAGTEPSLWFVALMGITTVLIGLACIIFLCTLMSFICRKFSKSDEQPPVQNAKQETPAAASSSAATSSASVQMEIPRRTEMLAAVTAAIAEELGTDISALRVLSFRRAGEAASEPIPARGELIAAVSAAIAEELGTDVSAIRIHSLRKIS